MKEKNKKKFQKLKNRISELFRENIGIKLKNTYLLHILDQRQSSDIITEKFNELVKRYNKLEVDFNTVNSGNTNYHKHNQELKQKLEIAENYIKELKSEIQQFRKNEITSKENYNQNYTSIT